MGPSGRVAVGSGSIAIHVLISHLIEKPQRVERGSPGRLYHDRRSSCMAEDRDGSEKAPSQIDALPHPLEQGGLNLADGLPPEGLSHTVQRERGEDLRDHR